MRSRAAQHSRSRSTAQRRSVAVNASRQTSTAAAAAAEDDLTVLPPGECDRVVNVRTPYRTENIFSRKRPNLFLSIAIARLHTKLSA